MANPIEIKIKEIISKARLDPGELRIIEGQLVGRHANEQLVHEAKYLIDNLVRSRPPSYEPWGQEPVMKDEVYVPGRAPVPHKIAPHAAYHSASDANGRCPHCYAQGNQSFLGILTVDGQDRPTYHCTSCNKAYAELPASIKVIAEELVKGGAEKVGFTPMNSSAANPNLNSSSNYQLESNTMQTNQKLDMVSGNIQTLSYTIQNLMEQVRVLAEQNNKMMVQLATDPLISVRKAVSEFNLK